MWKRAAALGFCASIALNTVPVLAQPDWRIVPAMLAAWYIADFASGLIHMYMDYRPCAEGSRLDELFFYEGHRGSPAYKALHREIMSKLNLFEQLVFDFKAHHPRPLTLGRRDLLAQVWATVAVLTLPVSLLLNLAWLTLPVPPWFMAGAVTALIAGTLSQYFHGTLHRRANPWIIPVMRRLHLLITVEAHDLHHATLDRDFATISGWSNPVLNRVFNWLKARGSFNPAGLEPARDKTATTAG
ncbi:carotenoid synthesis regulator CarF [Oleomonas cavernae]|uniref:Carotenoid synthesis regulator CarF n=1 Tax=Oleomonas cavernae TaxID=2320859 RepID=A0A418WEQ1_9PROT|nr:fatty acid desaturase CarF family protein [Oleomonas cavernae]RJF88501.1 carotenoid synthesis regulator CarF [Oleomonas cavernae]